MKSGAGFPSYAPAATWAAQAGVFDANYPASNVGDLIEPGRVARANAGANVSITGVLSASELVQFFAVVNHNLPAGSTMQIQGYSTTNPDGGATGLVYDSGVLQVWPSGGPVSGYRSVRPIVLVSPVSIRSFRIVFFNNGAPIEIGGIEVSGFWAWDGISYGRQIGFRSKNDRDAVVGGATTGPGKRAEPRVVRGQIDFMKMALTSTTGLDFQKGLDIQRPFVWAQDFDDPASWARTAMLVRNEEVPPMVGRLYRHDAFPIKLVEHLR